MQGRYDPDPALPSRVVATLTELGPYFAVDIHERSAPPTGSWRPMSELAGPSTALAARVDAVRVSLAATRGRDPEALERRVVASITHMGLVARLAAPAIAVAALGQPGWWPSLRSTWWQDRLGGPFPVSVPVATEDGDPRGASPSHPASDDAIEVLTTTMIEHFGLIPRIGWGNVASVVNSAAMQVAAVRPDLALQARSAADTVLALPRIEDGVLLSGPRYRRRSCCLMYRVTVARGALCGDCVLG